MYSIQKLQIAFKLLINNPDSLWPQSTFTGLAPIIHLFPYHLPAKRTQHLHNSFVPIMPLVLGSFTIPATDGLPPSLQDVAQRLSPLRRTTFILLDDKTHSSYKHTPIKHDVNSWRYSWFSSFKLLTFASFLPWTINPEGTKTKLIYYQHNLANGWRSVSMNWTSKWEIVYLQDV